MALSSDLIELLHGYCEVHTVPLAILEEALEKSGLQTHRNQTVSSVSSMITYEQWQLALASLYANLDDPSLGVNIGQCVRPVHGGVLAYMTLNAQSFAEALQLHQRYQRLVYGVELGTIDANSSNICRVTFARTGAGLGASLSDEVLIFALLTLTRSLAGQKHKSRLDALLAKGSICFRHDTLAPKKVYKQHGGMPVRFAQPDLSLEFPAEVLDLPVYKSDPALLRLLHQQADLMLRALPKLSDDFGDQIRTYLMQALPTGSATREGLAKSLGISSRTLNRRLANLQTTFSGLLRQSREELALHYLEDDLLSFSDIAHLLGYSEQSAFSRAFKKWTGKSPQSYRPNK